LRKRLPQWKGITRSKWIREVIANGVAIEFISTPRRYGIRRQPVECCRKEDQEVVDMKLKELRDDKVIERVRGRGIYQGKFLTIFTLTKSDGVRKRAILNAKPTNAHVKHRHFKMENMRTVQDLIEKEDWMTKVDISDAYFHINIRKKDRCWFRFRWKGKTWQFRSLPQGLSSAPRIWTAVLKEPARWLRAKGIRIVIYIDDILILSRSEKRGQEEAKEVFNLLTNLGFRMLEKKCVLKPAQEMEFLGYTINSKEMTFSVPRKKVRNLRKEAGRLINRPTTTPRQVACFVGRIVAHSLALTPAKLKTRSLMKTKNEFIRRYKKKGWDKPIHLKEEAKKELKWWRTQLRHWNGRAIIVQDASVFVESDASGHGFGGWKRTLTNMEKVVTRGFWKPQERKLHNNVRELLGGFYVIKATCQEIRDQTIQWDCDNIVAVSYVNGKGGAVPQLDAIARQLWSWCLKRNIMLVAKYKPGVLIPLSDALSRVTTDQHDWMLKPEVFHNIEEKLGPHTVDLFASRTTKQLPRYFSRFPDHEAEGVNAFHQNWKEEKGFANPPFALIGRVLAKARRDKARITLVTPEWKTAPWWPMLLKMKICTPMVLEKDQATFRPGKSNPNNPYKEMKWRALVWSISGKS